MNEELKKEYVAVQLAGYLSTFKEFENRHPQELLPLAKHCIEGLGKIIDSDEEDPTPWCSYGHKTAKECDCGPIADND